MEQFTVIRLENALEELRHFWEEYELVKGDLPDGLDEAVRFIINSSSEILENVSRTEETFLEGDIVLRRRTR